MAGTSSRLRDTRKTTPLLRRLEKYAVRAGGGSNHRFGLHDAILIKENHIVLAGGVGEAVRRARQAALDAPLRIEVEARNEGELREALASEADEILLDNCSPQEAARLVAIARRERPGCILEISGGLNLSNVRTYAAAGADFLSAGAVTHSAPAADLSLLVQRGPLK
jgi:nicotinate-nucleotide pyrophosphorylase (carboxylating)